MLSPDDQRRAHYGGWGRYNRRRAAGAKATYGIDHSKHTPEVDIAACGAEIEVSNFLGIPWVDDPNPDYEGDVGNGNQVRHTSYRNGHLLIHPPDRNEHVFYLVTGPFPDLTIRGWILGGRAKRPEWWKELQRGRPAFCVPQSALNGLDHIW